MTVEGARPFAEGLAARRDVLLADWLARTLGSYPEHTSRFLARERDPFRNPVGHTFRKALPALLDYALGGLDGAAIMPALDGVVRIRAVQDFTAGQAVAFVFLLKTVLRKTLGGEGPAKPDGEALALIEGRIDEMALLAFDLFMRCRERTYEVRANEARRRTYLMERMQRMDPLVPAGGGDAPSGGPAGGGVPKRGEGP